MHEEPLIEKIVEDPPHVTSTESSDDWEWFHDYFSDDDHIFTPDLPKDEIIVEYYSETYDENRNVQCVTPTYSPYNDDSMEDLLPCSHFSEEDEYGNGDKYSLDHDRSDEDSLMSDKHVEEESWTFMENPIYEENNEPETLDGFVDSPVYGISKGENMDLVALENFDTEKEHAVYPYDQSKPYITISNEEKEKLIS